jgi:DNA modification methylase
MGRRYIGVELKPEYAKQAARFIGKAESEAGSLLAGLDPVPHA